MPKSWIILGPFSFHKFAFLFHSFPSNFRFSIAPLISRASGLFSDLRPPRSLTKRDVNEFVIFIFSQFRVLGQKPNSVESVYPGSNDAQKQKKMTHPSAINLFLIFGSFILNENMISSDELIHQFHRYDLSLARAQINAYLQFRFFRILNPHYRSYCSCYDPFDKNMRNLFSVFMNDSISYLQMKFNIGSNTQRNRARAQLSSVTQIIRIIIPRYFKASELVSIAAEYSKLFSPELIQTIMKIVECLPLSLPLNDLTDYFEDWICEGYLNEPYILFNHTPFKSLPHTYESCFKVWLYRCFEDSIITWFEESFKILYNIFKNEFPALYNRFWTSVYIQNQYIARMSIK